jgi:hypothetical protein
MSATVLAHHPTGSHYICNPPVMNTDRDMIFLVDNKTVAGLELLTEGWTTDWKVYSKTDFVSYKKSVDGTILNVLLTEDKNYYDRFVLATNIAKRLNVLKKDDRIALFDAIVYGPEGEDDAPSF